MIQSKPAFLKVLQCLREKRSHISKVWKLRGLDLFGHGIPLRQLALLKKLVNPWLFAAASGRSVGCFPAFLFLPSRRVVRGPAVVHLHCRACTGTTCLDALFGPDKEVDYGSFQRDLPKNLEFGIGDIGV